ncbi:MAG: DUF58 domain-containing protein [Betaproteobacteria bacterium]
MRTINRWFSRGPSGTAKDQAKADPQADATDRVLNAGTWATQKDLIALKKHAGTFALKQAGSARARLAGNHLSRFRGRGMDYQESRAYQAGDDVRSMDWRVTARTGDPHVKLYQEERERPIVLFLDLNPGMFFGSRYMLKSVVAARAAAVIAWAAADRGDRVGAMLFNGGHCDLQPRGGKHGVLQLIRQLVAHTDPRVGMLAAPAPGDLNAALIRLRRVSRPGSLVVLLGDFYGIDADTGSHLQRLRQHCDIVGVQIIDPLELTPPRAGRYPIAIGHAQGVLNTRSGAARHAYQDYFSQHHLAVAAIMCSHAIPLLRLATDDDIVAVLRRYFAADIARPPASRSGS